jgi:hypothetical protein
MSESHISRHYCDRKVTDFEREVRSRQREERSSLLAVRELVLSASAAAELPPVAGSHRLSKAHNSSTAGGHDHAVDTRTANAM